MTSESSVAEIDAEQVAWEWFAGAHPHEAYAQSPDRFWEYFKSQCHGVNREEMVKMLEDSV